MINFITAVYRELLILLLAVGLLLCLIRIRNLKKSLLKESREKLIPVLTLEIGTRKPGIFIKNQGRCYAKDIKIQDIQCQLDYEFEKTVVLKFDRVGILKPADKVKLTFVVFDGQYPLPGQEAQGLPVHLGRSTFEAVISCANIENSRYTVTLNKDKDGFHIKNILSCPA